MINDQDVIEAIHGALPDAIVQLKSLDCSKKGYYIEVESASFNGQSLVQQHKIVKNALSKFLNSEELHAVTIKTKFK